MNKKIVIGIIIILAVIAIGAAFFMRDSSSPSDMVTASYTDGTTTIEALFDNDAETVTFTQASVGTITLDRAVSASGARYTDKEERIVFWEHQNEVTITKGYEELFKGTKISTTP